MMSLYDQIVILSVLSIILASGCVQEEKEDSDGIVCNSPYIRVGMECCLDRNADGVCDADQTTSTRPTTAPTTSTTLPTTTTAPTTSSTLATTTTSPTTSTTSPMTVTTSSTTTTVTTTSTLPAPCFDPDGEGPYTKQTVSKGYKAATDRCLNTATLFEYVCAGNIISSKTIQCGKGCKDGACIGCVDTDGGQVTDTKGVVTLGKELSKEDYCSNQGDDGNILREFFCKGVEEVGSVIVTCPTSCADGRCV